MPDRHIRLQRDVVLPRVVEKREGWLYVIAIEGEKTEEAYFQKFGDAKVKVDILPTFHGDSSEPESILQRLRKYKQNNNIQVEDRCWLVFDVDDRDDQRLNTVCAEAKKEYFQVAVSNPCFEFWLFLHKFEANELSQEIYQVSPEKRSRNMKKILSETLNGYDYKSLSYKDFCEDVKRAIQRAKDKENGRKKQYPKFPGTDVYKVVARLPVKVNKD